MEIVLSDVHLDLGAGRRGTDMGPGAMHVAGIDAVLKKLGHNLDLNREIHCDSLERMTAVDLKAKFINQITQVCSELSDGVYEDVKSDKFPLVLGGDHAIAMGTVSGVAKAFREQEKSLGVIWVDAHTDMNTPDTSPTGNIHGMPLATLLGHGHEALTELNGEAPSLKPENVALIGIRDVDLLEVPLVKELGVRAFQMKEIDRRGIGDCMDEAIEIVTQDTEGVHLSFDLDGVDPRFAPGVGTAVQGGLTIRESHYICEVINESQKLVSAEFVELNPTLDVANQTAKLAVWLIESLLGTHMTRN